jgi:maltooligosyltrehalose trehalohydrolase
MEPATAGWWRTEAGAPPGSDYAFVVNGGEPLPDPRSPWQPNGIHGASRTFDHAAFAWTDQRWQPAPLAAAVIYELHVGSFTPEGTFDAAVAMLDYLAGLGVTHVEIMPVAEFSGSRGWGYDGVDLYAPHSAYGGPDGLKRLVDACHARGLAVILDVVYNHLGPAGNYLERFGPYFTQRFGTPWGKAVNLDDQGSDEVRRFFIDNALMWLRDYHIDGLRLDAVHAIFDQSAVHFLEQLQTEVDQLGAEIGRHLVLIAESSLNDPRLMWSVERGGYGLAASWCDDFHHAVHTLLTGERAGYYEDFGSIGDLARVLSHGFVYDGRYSSFRGRSHGRPATGLSGHRFVASTQTHDQVGNRARGERLSHLCSLAEAKIAAALLLTGPFVPMLFQGEEWAASTPFHYFTDHEDPDLGARVTAGRRQEFAAFGWAVDQVPDPQDEQTFLDSKLRWDELEKEPHESVLDWYRELIMLRKRTAALKDGRLDRVRVEKDEDQRWLHMRRGDMSTVVNFSASRVTVPLAEAAREIVLASDPLCSLEPAAAYLPAESVVIARLMPDV